MLRRQITLSFSHKHAYKRMVTLPSNILGARHILLHHFIQQVGGANVRYLNGSVEITVPVQRRHPPHVMDLQILETVIRHAGWEEQAVTINVITVGTHGNETTGSCTLTITPLTTRPDGEILSGPQILQDMRGLCVEYAILRRAR